jgi:hypothetical protein
LSDPHGSEGRNFSVSYADVGGRDVVHLSMSLRLAGNARKHLHARAAIDGRTISFDSPGVLSSFTLDDSTMDPDVPATALSRDGMVIDTSAWFREPSAYGFAYAWRSQNAETGSSWTPGFVAPVRVASNVVQIANAKNVLADDSGTVHSFYEAGDVEPNPKTVYHSVFSGSWSTPTAVFADGRLDPNDWSVVLPASGVAHAARRLLDGGHEHVRKAGTAAWTSGAPIPPISAATGAGLVLLAKGERLRLVTIASDGAVVASAYDGAAWAPWKTLVPASPGRSYISACATKTPDTAAVIWTERSADGWRITGMRIAF